MVRAGGRGREQKVAFVLGWIPWRAHDTQWWLEVAALSARISWHLGVCPHNWNIQLSPELVPTKSFPTFTSFPRPSHISNPSNAPLCVPRMKSPLSLRLPNPVPAPTLSNCCPKRKGSLPKTWRLHLLKMVLSTQSQVTAPPWIPGKGPFLTRPQGPDSSHLPLPSGILQLGEDWPRVLGACAPPCHCLIPCPASGEGAGKEGRSPPGLLLALFTASPPCWPFWQWLPGTGSSPRDPGKSVPRWQGLREAQS